MYNHFTLSIFTHAHPFKYNFSEEKRIFLSSKIRSSTNNVPIVVDWLCEHNKPQLPIHLLVKSNVRVYDFKQYIAIKILQLHVAPHHIQQKPIFLIIGNNNKSPSSYETIGSLYVSEKDKDGHLYCTVMNALPPNIKL